MVKYVGESKQAGILLKIIKANIENIKTSGAKISANNDKTQELGHTTYI